MIQVAHDGLDEVVLDADYLVRLDNFEGPLDLLLHLIQQDEIEIWEISISRITRQYVEYLEMMNALNIEIAGEFLLMAAGLMRIKSQRLLPRPPQAEQDDDSPLTEQELIQQLLSYKMFKEAAASLRRRQEKAGPRFPRGSKAGLPKGYLYPLEEVDLFRLIAVLHSVERRDARQETVHAVQLDDVRLEDRVAFVLAALDEAAGRLKFLGLFPAGSPRMVMAVTFLAILELTRQQVIKLAQDQPFDDIWVVLRESEGAVTV